MQPKTSLQRPLSDFNTSLKLPPNNLEISSKQLSKHLLNNLEITFKLSKLHQSRIKTRSEEPHNNHQTLLKVPQNALNTKLRHFSTRQV